MTFQKGNKLATVNKGRPQAKTLAWNNIVGWLVGDGGHRFKEILGTISTGGEVTKEEKEFLGHYKDLLEYHQPKLARTEITGEGGGPLQIQPISYAHNPDSIQVRTEKLST
jgi:hypothetical protein